MAQLEALRAYVAQVQGDDDFRGDPRIVDQGRALVGRSVELGLPLELFREVQAIVRDYDEEAGRPRDQRGAWFKERGTIEKRQDFLSIVECILKHSRNELAGFSRIAAMGKDTVAASQRIPPEMTARDAALEFCAFVMDGFDGSARGGRPQWAAMGHDPL